MELREATRAKDRHRSCDVTTLCEDYEETDEVIGDIPLNGPSDENLEEFLQAHRTYRPQDGEGENARGGRVTDMPQKERNRTCFI
jgi:hypothetical protein